MSQQANARIIRWSLILAQYNYKIVHKPGKDNLIADCLSRLPIKDDIIINTPNEYINLINFALINVTFEDIA